MQLEWKTRQPSGNNGGSSTNSNGGGSRAPAPVKVRGIENADKNTKAIATWINGVEELHKSKPPPTVKYLS
jgi:hypothetical protein